MCWMVRKSKIGHCSTLPCTNTKDHILTNEFMDVSTGYSEAGVCKPVLQLQSIISCSMELWHPDKAQVKHILPRKTEEDKVLQNCHLL